LPGRVNRCHDGLVIWQRTPAWGTGRPRRLPGRGGRIPAARQRSLVQPRGWWQVDVGGTRRARRWRQPAVTELDGQVVRRWTEVVRDDDGPLYRYWVAIDDGQSDLTPHLR